ncbi:hypothetical protein NH340_JMT06974 [Sarcoptes scabiei]|nr:hypothetical protein NH340_JMT06974 [Sarcoptes scabiei]
MEFKENKLKSNHSKTSEQSSAIEKSTTIDASNDHPLSNDSIQKNSQTIQMSLQHKISAELLGIRFLKNDRQTFENEVERSMNQLVQRKLIDRNGHKSFIPKVLINVPDKVEDFVEILFSDQLNPEQIDDFIHQIKSWNEDFLNQPFENIDQNFFDRFLKNSIKIAVNQVFLYRGQLKSPVENCLTLATIFHPSQEANIKQPNRYQQCLILFFQQSNQITELLNIFRHLHRVSNSFQPISSNVVVSRANEYKVIINADLEIQEELIEGKFQSALREKDYFRLRTKVDKKIIINLQQDLIHYSFPIIRVEKCFGMLLSQGRNVSPNQMAAIGLSSMSSSIPNPETIPHQQQWQIVANWIPAELDSDHLNTETPRNSKIFFTIALDLIFESIEEPIRFIFESKAKIVPASISTTEKLWKNIANLSKHSQRCMQENFNLIIRQRPDLHGRIIYEVLSCLSSTQIAMQKQRLSSQLNTNKIVESSQTSEAAISNQEDDDTETSFEDDDEPLQSGSGEVSKNCSENQLQAWRSIMEQWHNDNLAIRPKKLATFIRREGIPQALRPEVWQLLSKANEIEDKILPKYKLLIMQESQYESIILRDISRTFTAHEKFRDPGQEQESLFRICKAYSNYDAEIGYCQGLSYLVAALLLTMPEEQAFCVLIQIMYRYGLRDLFKSGLENLHCKFYELERLLDEQLPELFCHFADLHIEAHMYASQWFLTLYTTKFPLNMVFMIIDLFLSDEMNVLLQIAMSLLQMSKNDLLALDFEGRVKKYQSQYREWREKNRDPFEILQTENKRLMQTVARLEQENDDLAQEMLNLCQSKIKMKTDVDRAEEKSDTLNLLLLQTRTHLVDSEEERKQLAEEIKNLKDMCRKEMDRYEIDKRNDRKIIEEYKNICKNYQAKLENEKIVFDAKIDSFIKTIQDCEECRKKIENILDDDSDRKDLQKTLSNDENSNDNNLTNSRVSNLNWKNFSPPSIDSVEFSELSKKIQDLESELIKTKIALAESENRYGNDEQRAVHSNTWFSKTLSSLRDVTTNKYTHLNEVGDGFEAEL